MTKDRLWHVGQFLSIVAGCLVGAEYSVSAGAAVSLLLCFLVDIRREVQE